MRSRCGVGKHFVHVNIPCSSKVPYSTASLPRVQLSHCVQLMPTVHGCDGDTVHVSSAPMDSSASMSSMY